MRAAVKYGRAIAHSASLYNRLGTMKDSFDFEVSVDETDAPTSALEHYFIANELTRQECALRRWRPASSGASRKAWITSETSPRWMQRWHGMPR